MYDFRDFKVRKVDYQPDGIILDTYDTGIERAFRGATKSVSSAPPNLIC